MGERAFRGGAAVVVTGPRRSEVRSGALKTSLSGAFKDRHFTKEEVHVEGRWEIPEGVGLLLLTLGNSVKVLDNSLIWQCICVNSCIIVRVETPIFDSILLQCVIKVSPSRLFIWSLKLVQKLRFNKMEYGTPESLQWKR